MLRRRLGRDERLEELDTEGLRGVATGQRAHQSGGSYDVLIVSRQHLLRELRVGVATLYLDLVDRVDQGVRCDVHRPTTLGRRREEILDHGRMLRADGNDRAVVGGMKGFRVLRSGNLGLDGVSTKDGKRRQAQHDPRQTQRRRAGRQVRLGVGHPSLLRLGFFHTDTLRPIRPQGTG